MKESLLFLVIHRFRRLFDIFSEYKFTFRLEFLK